MMPPRCNLRAVRLFGRRRRCSSLPVNIPTAETRRRRHQIGLAPATALDRARPSGRRIVHLALEYRKFRAVLTADENATLSSSMR